MIWTRPGLQIDRVLDTAIFDVDGVLIDTTGSYRLSVIATTEYLVGERLGLWQRAAGAPLVTLEDVRAFKLAGGFNNDWDLAFAFTALCTARLREWRGQPQSALSLEEWATRAYEATQQGQGGIGWARAVTPASAQPEYALAQTVHDEFYWGAALLRELLHKEPRYVLDAPGLVRNETILAPSTLLSQLADQGIQRSALITGRVGAEVTWAARLLEQTLNGGARFLSAWGLTPFERIVPGEEIAKPDPAALTLVAHQLHTQAGFYVGDTADDLALVLNYRASAESTQPPFLAIMISSGPEADIYRQRGADLILSHISELPAALAQLQEAGMKR
ncbi:MAG TPA: HAD family hydrolase [Ktedonobacterales bacterium]|nr:HAD family hydrolase [Ktedonobacterales bacterium]